MPKGTTTQKESATITSSPAFDWKDAVTRAHVGLSVPQAVDGRLERREVGFVFEFEIDALMEVYRQHLLQPEGDGGGMGFDTKRAHWAVFREFCVEVVNFAGLEELSMAQVRKLFETTPRLKTLAEHAGTVLINQVQVREAKLQGPLKTPAS